MSATRWWRSSGRCDAFKRVRGPGSAAQASRRQSAAAGNISIINSEWIVFNIKGNDYRLVVAVDFEKAIVWIKWIGSHRNYDRINVEKVAHHD